MPRQRLIFLSLAAVAVLGGVSMIGLGVRGDASGGALPASGLFGPRASPTSAAPDPAELARRERQRRVAALDAALQKYAATAPEFSVAVLDRKTGERYAYRGKEKYETASIVKVQVLACLLLKAQDADRELTTNELTLARRMIRVSDNDATTTLYNRLGRIGGISASNKRLGLRSTTVNSAWGLTRTTVDDQVRLLAELVDPKGPLNSGSRKIAFELMSTVDAAQDWGVSAPAKAGERVAIKNGWLSRSTDDGRWIVNSVGRITGGADVSLAVLSHDNATQEAGIALVEDLARLTRANLKW